MIKKIQLQVISPRHSPDLVVISHAHEKDYLKPLMTGRGDINYLCGGCRSILAERMYPRLLDGYALRCEICNSYNRVSGRQVYDLAKMLTSLLREDKKL